MPIRDIFVSLTVVLSLPYCFQVPWVGVLMWSWLGYMNPHKLSWGFATRMPFAQMVALATLAGLLISKERRPLPRTAEVFFLFALWGTFVLSTLFALYPSDAWEQLDKVSKILIMTFVTMVLFQDQQKLRALLWVIALSLGFYGLKGGVFAVLTGGRYEVQGPAGTFINGNTEIGLALNMTLPLLVFLRREETRPWLRHLLLATFAFSILAIVITYSRGAFLGLGIVLCLLFLKSRIKVITLFLLVLAVPVALATLPQKWFGKMETITDYEQDKSAMGRLQAWQLAAKLALDHPLLGGGFRPFSPEVYGRYFSDNTRSGADAHSIYFQVLAEHGFTGMALYLGLIFSTMLSLRRMIWKCRGDPSLQWAYNYSQMLETSLIAYLTCGAFLSLSYFDLFFHLVAITAVLKKLVLVQQQEKVNAGSQPAFARRVSSLTPKPARPNVP